MVDYELLRINYFQNDLPCPFELKRGGKINIYPILVKDYSLYEFYKTIMEFDKNSINDIVIIQMSYLDFLVNIVFQQDKDSGGKLCGYLSLILKEDKVSIVENKGKYCIVILDEKDSIKYPIKSKELEEMKAFVIGKTGILMREINEMTYRNFFMVYESTLGSEIYISQKIIQASEKYKVDDFQHPLFTEKKSKVDEVFSTDAEQFKKKMENVT